MKLTIHSVALALGALSLALTPAIADAKRIYFLVGVRHVYRIGPDRDLYVDQREDIEKTYADGVASDEATYQQHVQGGADAATEAQARDQDLELLAEDRDKSLGALFDVRDDLRTKYPEFQIKGDGPYQVIGVDYHVHEDVMVFDDFCPYAPWPGYVVVGRPYGGWVYGTVYTPGLFVNVYNGWYSGWSASISIGFGGPVFFGGFVGHAGPVPWHGGVFAGPVAVWSHPGGYYHAVGVREGFIGAHGGFVRGAAPGFRGAGPGFRGAAAGHPAPGGFNRGAGAPARAGSGWGGYTHSGGAANRGGFGGGAHPDAARPGGSAGAGAGHGWGDSRGATASHGVSGYAGGTSASHSGPAFGDRSASSNHSGSGFGSHSGGYSHSGGSHSSSHSQSHGGSHNGSNHDSHDHH